MPALWRLFACMTLVAAFLPLSISRSATAAAVSSSETGFLDAGGPGQPPSVGHNDALLTILYNASTYGELRPCPT